MITPVNGNTEVRQRTTETATVLPCGCAHAEREWLQMCRAHLEEWKSLHIIAEIARLACESCE